MRRLLGTSPNLRFVQFLRVFLNVGLTFTGIYARKSFKGFLQNGQGNAVMNNLGYSLDRLSKACTNIEKFSLSILKLKIKSSISSFKPFVEWQSVRVTVRGPEELLVSVPFD